MQRMRRYRFGKKRRRRWRNR